MISLINLSAFIVTPTDETGIVNTDHLARLVAHAAQPGIASIGVLGSTGSYIYLSADQRARALAAAVEAAGDTPVIAGIGALTTHDVLHNLKAAEQAGAAGVLLAPVTYLPLMEPEVANLFCTVAANTDLPVCFYNNPGTTGFTPSESLITDLAADGTIAAVKMPPAPEGDFAGQIDCLRTATPDDFTIGYSGDAFIAGALEAGADAWYSVLAGTLPDVALRLWNAKDDPAQLAAVNESLAPLWALFNAHGSIRVIYEVVNSSGLGPYAPLPPQQPLPQDVRGQIELALDAVKQADHAAA
ncbi:MAG: dihydrodipicolinate synthase family protein [Pseudomonadota bacterium]